MAKIFIPRTMGTQHPDNVNAPSFYDSALIQWEWEIKEAVYSFKELNIDEQMWDFEWKETNSHVIKKVLTADKDYFKENILWKNKFLTFRLPNPYVEKLEAKLAFETLHSIPRSFDISKVFYKKDIAPIFETILPMTTSFEQIYSIKRYYDKYIIWQENSLLLNWFRVKDVVWEFFPKQIYMIPLIEDLPSMSDIERIVEPCIKKLKQPYLRLFLARSDPALNYWYVSAFLMLEIVLQKLHKLEKKYNYDIYPIIWVWWIPFRWNFNPYTIKQNLSSYPSVQTYTIQSSFKYDYEFDNVKSAIDLINTTKRSSPRPVDERTSIDIIKRYTRSYTQDVEKIEELVNHLSKYVPKRRRRKLHIWLFGYSRKWGQVMLPRAITFAACMYSIWIPPEFLGFECLTKKDLEYLNQDSTFITDIKAALKYLNFDLLKQLYPKIARKIEELFDLDLIDKTYSNMSNLIWTLANQQLDDQKEKFLRAMMEESAVYRNFIW